MLRSQKVLNAKASILSKSASLVNALVQRLTELLLHLVFASRAAALRIQSIAPVPPKCTKTLTLGRQVLRCALANSLRQERRVGCYSKSEVEISIIERVTRNCVGAVTRLSIVMELDT
jgi:hypothetical protein